MQRVSEPERAQQERTLPAGQAVDPAIGRGAVTQQQAMLGQLPLHGFDGAHDPLVVPGQKPHPWDQQQCRVEALRTEELGEWVYSGIRRLPSSPYMIRRSTGSPATARSNHSRYPATPAG